MERVETGTRGFAASEKDTRFTLTEARDVSPKPVG